MVVKTLELSEKIETPDFGEALSFCFSEPIGENGEGIGVVANRFRKAKTSELVRVYININDASLCAPIANAFMIAMQPLIERGGDFILHEAPKGFVISRRDDGEE